MSHSASDVIAWLRAAGEPSRLRLLALCDQADLSVSDLAQALGQSEPRVCRHLRILSEARLIERTRNGQWVHYRLARNAPAAGFVKGLLAQVDRGDPSFARDLDRAMSESGDSGESRTAESRLGRALKGFIDANAAAERVGSVLVVGVDHLELLESAAALGSECTAIAHSRRAVQSARAFCERRGINCRVLQASTGEGLNERDLVKAGQLFDAVLLDHLATANSDFAALIGYGRRALAANGRLWLFERYESLEVSRERAGKTPRDKVVEHPLARLRRLLGDQNLSCERLSPIEADDEHVLAAVAVPAAHREQMRRA
jgi:DNA-binding transcriptional ArsR family regulator